ncbi:hypothetical protein ACHAXR_005891 [Thalassiosira sp. AJA248-18]
MWGSPRLRTALQVERNVIFLPIFMTRRHVSSPTALAASSMDNTSESEESLPRSKGERGGQDISAPKRGVDDYDSLFFVPAKPETSGGSPSINRDYPKNENDGESSTSGTETEKSDYSGDAHSYGTDDSWDRKGPSVPRPQATSTPSQEQRRIVEQSQTYYETTTSEQQYSKSQTNQHRRTQQREQQNEPASSSILSTRALYQFRPLPPGSSRPMPPTISEYDSYDYNIGEGDGEDLDNVDLDVSNYDYPVDMDHNIGEPVTRTSRETELTRTASETQNELSTKEAIESPFNNAPKDTPPPPKERVSVSKSVMTSSAPSYPNSMRRITPSFMEPEKTKAMIGLNDEGVENSNNSERKMPLESSNGNGSTTHLTSLTSQLEHLTSQIYQLNDGVEFNINSPKQVARVLFGEDNTGDSSTNKDVLEAMASAGNEMAAHIYKFRKLSRAVKREKRRVEQLEKGDKKNDYYGNLARHRENVAVSKYNADSQESNVTNTNIYEDDDAKPSHHRREPLLLIDASAYIFRSYHAIPPLHRSDGTPTGALHGVCRMLQNLLLTRLLRGDRPRVVLAFDFKGPNFRHVIYPEYKANRGPCPEDLVPQFELVREAADAFGVAQVEAEGYEADDVIATLAKQALDDGVDVDIFSGDKDLMQLITPPGIEPSVHMIDSMHFDRVNHDDVVKKWGVSADKLGDVLALAGDSSDNIPGAPGIGPKIAATLINEYTSLPNLINNADQIKQNKRRESLIENAEKIQLYRKLVTLDDSIPIGKMTLPSSFQGVSTLRMSAFDPNR